MPEVPHARQDHSHAVLIRSCDDFFITHRPPGLNYRSDAVFSSNIDPIAEREKSIRSHRRAVERKPFVGRFHCGDTGAHDAAHLPGADAECLAIARLYDRVRFDVRHHGPCEAHIGQLGVGWLARRHDFELYAVQVAMIPVLKQQPSVHRA